MRSRAGVGADRPLMCARCASGLGSNHGVRDVQLTGWQVHERDLNTDLLLLLLKRARLRGDKVKPLQPSCVAAFHPPLRACACIRERYGLWRALVLRANPNLCC